MNNATGGTTTRWEQIHPYGYLGINIAFLLILISWLTVGWKYGNLLYIALSAGGLGGWIHEIAQSKDQGTIAAIYTGDDGLHLGAIAGIILGVVAGVLILNPVTGELGQLENASVSTPNLLNVSASAANGAASNLEWIVAFNALMAGLALKGIVDATTSKQPG